MKQLEENEEREKQIRGLGLLLEKELIRLRNRKNLEALDKEQTRAIYSLHPKIEVYDA